MEIFDHCNNDCKSIATYSCSCAEPSLKLCDRHFLEHSNSHSKAEITRLALSLPSTVLATLKRSMITLTQSSGPAWYPPNVLKAKASKQIIKCLDPITHHRVMPKNSSIPFIRDFESLASEETLSEEAITQVINSATTEYTKCAELAQTIAARVAQAEATVVTIESLDPEYLQLLEPPEQKELTKMLTKYRDLAQRSITAIKGFVGQETIKHHENFFDCLVEVNCVAVTSCGQRVIAGTDKGDLFVWHIHRQRSNHLCGVHQSIINTIAIHPHQLHCASGCNDGDICITDLASYAVQSRLNGGTGVSSVSYSRSGELLAAAHHGRAISVWHVSQGDMLHYLKVHTDIVTSVSFTWDEDELVSGSEDNSIVLWRNFSSNVRGQRLKQLNGPVCSVAVARSKQLIAAAGDDSEILIWKSSQAPADFEGSKQKCEIIKTGDTEFNSVVFSPDEEYFAASANSGNVYVWTSETLTLVQKLSITSHPIFSVAFTPDNTHLISAGKEGIIRYTPIRVHHDGSPQKRPKLSN